ncbi:MAG TPA: fasciclin domain-containing protein [Brevundimonas sp.]|nr:fasciclin domain-containing protein [Brevundimonas sp.]
MPCNLLFPAVASIALAAASGAIAQTAPAPAQRPVTPATAATPAVPAAQATEGQAPRPANPATPARAATPATPASAARPSAAGNVIEVLRAQGNFSTLLAALDAAQLTQTLSSRSTVTIFAPSDEAFAALPEAERARLMDPANRQALRSLLLYHVIVADVSSADIMGTRGGVETAGRTHVLIDGTGEGLRIDGATITRADIDASNGAVFAIDKVLNPAESMASTAPEGTPAAPGSPSTVVPASPAGMTATTRPASPGATAPNGQPSAVTTTVASPPVRNPTDGQVDRQPDPSRPRPPGS